jgi:hypothetical protein
VASNQSTLQPTAGHSDVYFQMTSTFNAVGYKRGVQIMVVATFLRLVCWLFVAEAAA